MSSRLGLRSLAWGAAYCRRLVKVTNGPLVTSVRRHSDTPPQPYSNMPFKIKSRFATTVFFAVFFGIGLWAPFIIVWYSMIKKTL